jgi:hypothetical protein
MERPEFFHLYDNRTFKYYSIKLCLELKLPEKVQLSI